MHPHPHSLPSFRVKEQTYTKYESKEKIVVVSSVVCVMHLIYFPADAM